MPINPKQQPPYYTQEDNGPTIKQYIALLTQTSTGAPTATVLKNTLGGTITWARSSQGYYTGTLTGKLPINKLTAIAQNTSGNVAIYDIGEEDPNNAIYLATYLQDGITFQFNYDDGLLVKTPIIITIYP